MAEKLGMTVAQLRAEVSSQEWTEWDIYFARREQRRQLAERMQKGGTGA